jgi:hypothetical protein
MAGIRASTPDLRHRAPQMGRSASKIAEPEAKSEAQAKPREASLQSETAVHASPLGQPGETTRNPTSGPKDEIDADGIDDLKLDAPRLWPALSPIAPLTGPPMAPGIGGFNIDSPVPRASRVEGEVAIAHTRRQALPSPNLAPQAPIRAQRMALIVESGDSSFIPRLLAVIAIVGVILLTFREETRKQLNDILEAAMSSYKVASAETSAHQPRLVVENQKGFANEPLPLGISVKDGSGVETLTVAGLAEGIELSLGTPQGSTGWLVSARDLDKTFIGTRQDFVGVMDATVTLRSPLGERLDRQVIRFEWAQKKQEPSMPTLAPPAPTPGLPPLDPAQIAGLIKLGQDLLKHGDVESARFLLKRAAIAGNAQAALELGLTFDGAVLAQSGVLGIGSDVGQAREWYERAIRLGSTEASRHLERLASMPK